MDTPQTTTCTTCESCWPSKPARCFRSRSPLAAHGDGTGSVAVGNAENEQLPWPRRCEKRGEDVPADLRCRVDHIVVTAAQGTRVEVIQVSQGNAASLQL